jgi:hypothetical protein
MKGVTAMPATIELTDQLIIDIRCYGAMRRIACDNPVEGDYDLADVDPADWAEHNLADEEEMHQYADDLAGMIVDALAELVPA